MKKYLFIICISTISLISFAQQQQASLTESTMGLQIGTFGIWVYNEAKITNSLALRSDLGLDGYITSEDINFNNMYFIPSASIEPRWYYNLKKRVRESKRIDSNSGDFISLKLIYNPNIFTISKNNNINILFNSMFSIIPTWGFRRAIGRNFNFETALGPGYRYGFSSSTKNTSGFIYYVNLRIGFVF